MLLTANELKTYLGISKDLAYSLIHAAGFPTIKIGGRYYVSEDALKRWLEKYEGKEFLL